MIDDKDLIELFEPDKFQKEKLRVNAELFFNDRQTNINNNNLGEGHHTRYYNGFFKDGMKHGIG